MLEISTLSNTRESLEGELLMSSSCGHHTIQLNRSALSACPSIQTSLASMILDKFRMLLVSVYLPCMIRNPSARLYTFEDVVVNTPTTREGSKHAITIRSRTTAHFNLQPASGSDTPIPSCTSHMTYGSYSIVWYLCGSSQHILLRCHHPSPGIASAEPDAEDEDLVQRSSLQHIVQGFILSIGELRKQRNSFKNANICTLTSHVFDDLTPIITSMPCFHSLELRMKKGCTIRTMIVSNRYHQFPSEYLTVIVESQLNPRRNLCTYSLLLTTFFSRTSIDRLLTLTRVSEYV